MCPSSPFHLFQFSDARYLDLSGTACRKPKIPSWSNREEPTIFYSLTPTAALRHLNKLYPLLLFPSPLEPFDLHIKRLYHPPELPRSRSSTKIQPKPSYVAFGAAGSKRVHYGNTERERWEEIARHREERRSQMERRRSPQSDYGAWPESPPDCEDRANDIDGWWSGSDSKECPECGCPPIVASWEKCLCDCICHMCDSTDSEVSFGSSYFSGQAHLMPPRNSISERKRKRPGV